MFVVLDTADLRSLKRETVADIWATLKIGETKLSTPPQGTENWESNEPVDLTLEQVNEFMLGVHPKTKAGLRVFAEHGPIIDARMLGDAGIANYSHFQSTVTKRTRTITGNVEALLFGWDEWKWDSNEAYKLLSGRYAVSVQTHSALRQYFGLGV
jgi:hypothetical protein